MAFSFGKRKPVVLHGRHPICGPGVKQKVTDVLMSSWMLQATPDQSTVSKTYCFAKQQTRLLQKKGKMDSGVGEVHKTLEDFVAGAVT